MRTSLIAALAASTILTATVADAQTSRRGRGYDRVPPYASRSAPARGYDRYAEPPGGGIITSSTPYPNGNFSNPTGGGGGGGSNGP